MDDLILKNIGAEKLYKARVSELIRTRYSQDAVEALMSNWMSDPTAYAEEWATFQSFRAECKRMAREELGL